MKIPVLIYRVGANEPEKTEIEADYADCSDPKLRAAVKIILDRQRMTSPEHVHVLHNGGRRSMFVDEFGTGAFGREALPVNVQATLIYWNAGLSQGESLAKLRDGAPRIHGVAVLFPDHHVWS